MSFRVTAFVCSLTVVGVATAPSDLAADDAVPTGDAARFGAAELLDEGLARLSESEGYTATFVRQEAVGGTLREPETIALKVRNEPFAVYMKWTAGAMTGREVLYADGEFDGKMLVRPHGWRGRLVGTLQLDPDGSLALRDSRHPVTEAGLAHLAARIAWVLRTDREGIAKATYSLRPAVEGGRKGRLLILDAFSTDTPDGFRYTEVFIDDETLLPIRVRNYGWPTEEHETAAELAAATLLEDYAYDGLNLEPRLTVADFTPENPDYQLDR
ncbi:MAG: DUF1571 domain-containing protein [Planctomycetota bacterium]